MIPAGLGPAAVLWDMDGTIVDSEGIWLDVTEAMLVRFGIVMTDATRELLVGSGLRTAAEHYRELGVPLSVEQMLAEWVSEVSVALHAGELQWRPGAREMLASLDAAGIPCALVTMSVRALADIVIAQLPAGTFQATVAGDEVVHEKPHPEPYLLGAKLLGVPIDQCVVIEDSPTGLRSGAAAGAIAIGVSNHVSLRGAPAAAVWPTLAGAGASDLVATYIAATVGTHSLASFVR